MTAVNKHILWTIGAAWALTACSADDGDDPAAFTPVPLQLQATILQQAGTRVTADSEWETGDGIYIRGVKGDDVEEGLNNALYVCEVSEDNSTVSFIPDSGDTYYIMDVQPITLTAVHLPGVEAADIPEDGVLRDQPARDFLFASTTASYEASQVELQFDHCMARVMCKFRNGTAELSEMELAAFTFDVEGLVTTGEFDTFTGTATAGSASTPLNGQTANTYIPVYPTSTAADVVLSFSFGEENYTATLSGVTFEAGKSYEYTITISSN
jgi:hypothetical protein